MTPRLKGSDALLARRRRYLLYCLYLYSNPMNLADVADQVTLWEDGEDVDGFLQRRLRVYNDLYHDHLPVLEEAGLVDYCQEEDIVSLSREGKRLEQTVERRYGSEITDLG